MKTYISTIFIILTVIAFSFTVKPDSKLYNQSINQAELLLIKSNYSEANKLYNEILKNYSVQMFTRDIWNYALSSHLVSDSIKVKECLQLLIKGGTSFEKIEKNQILSRYIDHEILKTIPKTDSLKTRLIDSLYIVDQSLRNIDSMYFKRKNDIKKIDDSNAEVLYKEFTKNGFPSEKDLGNSGMQKLNVLLLHQAFGQDRKYNLTRFVTPALLSGLIEPYQGIEFIIALQGRDALQHDNILIRLVYTDKNHEILSERENPNYALKSKYGYYKHANSNKKNHRADSLRNELGIGSIKQSRSKSIFSKSTNDSIGFQFFTLKTYSFNSKEDYDFFQTNFISVHPE
ncbi:hypothetical protein OAT71_02405 [Flavobacteriales bacterium]|nr:hypothetical protein [Flavobacteriales bacterium]